MSASAGASSQAVRRLRKELEQLQRHGNKQVVVRPSDKNMLEWHFVLLELPEDTVYAGGVYHGKLLFPEQYPHAPPSLIMITPSGRLEVKKRLCLSMTDFHPESWNPAWSIESMLVGVISFMIDEKDPGSFGALHESPETRRRLAADSVAFNYRDPEFRELFPELLRSNVEDITIGEGIESLNVSADGAVPDDRAESTAEAREMQEMQDEAVREYKTAHMKTAEATKELAPVDAEAALEDAETEEPGSSLAQVHPNPTGEDVENPSESIGQVPGSADAVGTASAAREQNAAGNEDDSEREECWICRQDASQEPLIQPCACRGSMSGVHASCVEDWIKHHRTQSLTDEVPNCSVCNQAYSGTEQRPGIVGYAQHLCHDCFRQAVRSAVLVGLLVAYWTAAQDDVAPLIVRLFLFLVSALFFIYKTSVLVISLPSGRPPPENRLRIIFIGDFRLLAVHMAEATAIVVIVGLWCAYGQLAYYYFLPVCFVVLLPLCAVLLRQQGSPFSLRTVHLIALILASPFFVLVHMAKAVYRDPKRLLDPCDGVLHVTIPMAAIPMCWFCTSNVPVLILWASHSFILLIGLFELCAVRRMEWKDGRIWWIFLQLSVLAAYVANLLHNFSEGVEPEHMALVIFAGSMFWLCLSCAIAVTVNWELCMRQYRTWQHRNGSFQLGNSSAQPSTIGAQADRAPAEAQATEP